MLAKRVDVLESYQSKRADFGSVYERNLNRRKLSVHARFVAAAFDVFPAAQIVSNVAALSQELERK